jgi:hypothetical protein
VLPSVEPCRLCHSCRCGGRRHERGAIVVRDSIPSIGGESIAQKFASRSSASNNIASARAALYAKLLRGTKVFEVRETSLTDDTHQAIASTADTISCGGRVMLKSPTKSIDFSAADVRAQTLYSEVFLRSWSADPELFNWGQAYADHWRRKHNSS